MKEKKRELILEVLGEKGVKMKVVGKVESFVERSYEVVLFVIV